MTSNQTWNQHIVKKENKSLVLETIKDGYPISRAEIANQTGLNKGTVSSLVNELIEEQLIFESGPGESSGGRRPVMLLFNQVTGYAIGIDVGVNYILGVLTDLQGEIFTERLVKYHDLPYEDILEKIMSMIDELMASAPASPYGIVGIGIGVPGVVNNEGKILLAPNLGWTNIDLKTQIEDKYGVPVIIENEANAGAYGEKKLGAGRNYENIIYVSVGIGIGVGLILNGRLYKGVNGFAGELGHMTIVDGGAKCRCGNEGCWELYASEQALVDNAKHLGLKLSLSDELTLEDLNELACKGDASAIKLFDQIGYYLGIGINNIINIFNPEQVIIGNRLASSEVWVNKGLSKSLEGRTLWFNQQNFHVTFSNLSTHSSALGAAVFAIEAFFENIQNVTLSV